MNEKGTVVSMVGKKTKAKLGKGPEEWRNCKKYDIGGI